MNSTGKVVSILGAAGLLAWGASSFMGEDVTETSSEGDSFIPTESVKADTDYRATRPSSTGDRDCGDFSSHRQAQAFFEDEGPGDPHGLDRDGDGVACETLP